ncbi:aerobactin siderophore biosynthesis protein IucA [Aliivibrio fischeri MJ11]|uniref:Aerobactin siderophore biosynthesis protein IucA n=1 Tax=Aliivibrio fischeri (strain MJ11) TaxID=388396 RepID=B5EST6_ALIFM|nr:IucA/IucC family protein [Aliivibrio fischeri]ACH63889.1 aerobactin siderophore biosynthesis protein IucA [Aliivibrio fischeri MJ11]
MKTNDEFDYAIRGGNDVPAACFLNSLARECAAIQIVKNQYEAYYRIPLGGSDEIQIPLNYVSSVGLHEYCFPAVLYAEKSRAIGFEEVVEKILEQPALVGLITKEQKETFLERVNESYSNTYIGVRNNPYSTILFSEALNFQQAEQGLLIGHSFHPAPKSREQFSEEDARKYSPELGGEFALCWLAVDSSILISGSSGQYNAKERLEQLVSQDHLLSLALSGVIHEGEHLFPVHPWQWTTLQEHEDIQSYIQSGLIRDLGEIGSTWYPTSSTRSLYSPTLPYMLKFSLSVKLTNSIRNLSLKEVIRGTRLNQLFHDTELNNELGQEQGFQVMQEPSYLGLTNKMGEEIDESLVAFRDNPLSSKPEEEAVVLATLTQQNPYGGESLLAKRIKHYANLSQLSLSQVAEQWFSAYCQYTVIPLFNLQANYGLVFLAHQQNIVMQMKSGFPIGMYYRDCQGTGYTDLAFERFPDALKQTKQDIENYWNYDKVRRYFAYYLIINSTFNVIASISAYCGVSEQTLLQELRKQLEVLKAKGVKDPRCLDYVLESEALCCKGNFYCYLQNMNENSIPDPSVIYFDLPNPLVHIKDAMNV